MAHDRPQQARRDLRLGQVITVHYQRRMACEIQFDGSPMEARSQLFLPEGTTPTIVIPAGHRQSHAPATYRGEGDKCRKGGAWNHGAVLKPEIEQITVEHKVIAHFGNHSEKAMKGRRHLVGCDSEVGVRDHNGVGRRHGSSIDSPAEVSQPAVIIELWD